MPKKYWYKSGLLWLSVSIIIIILDQWTKHLATKYLLVDYPYPVLPFLNWTLMFNSGAAFSFLNQFSSFAILLFSTISIVVSAIIIFWLYRLPARHIYLCLALALVLGGALANLYDRLFFGRVVDFIDFYVATWHFPIFNIADSMVCIGALLLFLWFYTPLRRFLNMLKYRAIKKEMELQHETAAEKELNALLRGYPSNHEYKVLGGQIYPSFQLFERLSFIKPLYPEKIERFLDVGGCRGFFVCDIAARPECQKAVGIDVDESFIEASRKVSEFLRLENTEFHLMHLDAISKNPEAFGGPFDLVLVLGLYHYLYFGSESCLKSYRSHDEIFAMLAKLCRGRVILSGRLEIERLPSWMRNNQEIAKCKAIYNTSAILKAASAWFDITNHGFMSKDSVYVLKNI